MITFSSRPPLSAARRARAGFTLVEAMVSTFVLGILGLGIVGSTLQLRSAAEATVREANANAVAIGFLEQLQGMDYTMLAQLAATDGDMVFVVRDGTALTVKLNQADFSDPLDIPINVDVLGEYTSNMDFWLLVEVEPSAGNLPSLDIKLRYRWENPHSQRVNEGELTLIRARTQN